MSLKRTGSPTLYVATPEVVVAAGSVLWCESDVAASGSTHSTMDASAVHAA
jgi:hypothetical protein